MCAGVQLYIQQWSNSGFSVPSACIYGGATGSTCDFSDTSKTMGAFATAHGSLVNAQAIGSGLATGASAYFTIGLQLPSSADNSYQGLAATMDFVFHIDQ